MATLEEALAGLNLTGADTGYGIATQAIGQMTPKLINPYGSTGQAIGISLGSVLLQSLLGYQARQEAARSTLEMNTLANQMQTLTTPQARTDFIAGVEDPLYQSRLSTLATALGTQEKKNALDIQKAKDLEIAKLTGLGDFYSSEAGKKYLAGEKELSIAKAAGLTSRAIAQNEASKQRLQFADDLRRDTFVFKKQLDEANPDVPAPVRTEAGEILAIATAAKRLAARVKDKINTYAELKLAKNFTDAGEGLKEEFDNLTDLLVRVRSGAAASAFETGNLGGILGGTVEVGPESAINLLDQFANNSYRLASDRLTYGAESPAKLAAAARQAAESNTMLDMTPKSNVIVPGTAVVTPTPVAIDPAELAKVKAALSNPAVPESVKQKLRERMAQYGLKE